MRSLVAQLQPHVAPKWWLWEGTSLLPGPLSWSLVGSPM